MGFFPVQSTCVKSVGHLCPYPELLEVLYDTHTRTRNSGISYASAINTRGAGIKHLRNLCEFLWPVPPNPELLRIL